MKFLQHVVEALAGIHKEFEKNLSSVFGEVKGQSTYKGVALVYFIV